MISTEARNNLKQKAGEGRESMNVFLYLLFEELRDVQVALTQ